MRWGDYAPAEIEEAGGGRTPVWRRTAHEEALSVPLGGDAGPVVRDVPGSGGLQLHVVERPIGAMGMPSIPSSCCRNRARERRGPRDDR